jgi:hypothetical protein|tara:strand:+ start:2550 stop:2927 length:378 start_codon:yes stop_codon:yes gene_type:complete
VNLRILFTLLLLTACYTSERNCIDFQTGTFEFESISTNSDTLITEFKRTKDLEIGYFNSSIDSSYVNWVSDCECIIKKINPKSMIEKKSVQMKILSTYKDTYVFEYSFVGDIQNRQRGTARKITD